MCYYSTTNDTCSLVKIHHVASLAPGLAIDYFVTNIMSRVEQEQ